MFCSVVTDLKVWFKSMRTWYIKLTLTKLGWEEGKKDIDSKILEKVSFLNEHRQGVIMPGMFYKYS